MEVNLHNIGCNSSTPTSIQVVTHATLQPSSCLDPTPFSILASKDNLYFISYRGVNSMCPRWYLVQIILYDDTTDNQYFVDFFQNIPLTRGRRTVYHIIGRIGTKQFVQKKEHLVETTGTLLQFFQQGHPIPSLIADLVIIILII